MADYITQIRTTEGDKKIDYTALANLPKSDTTLKQKGAFADAETVGTEIANLKSQITESVDADRLPIVPIVKGGTGAATTADARSNLGLGKVATQDTVPIANGGTGATTAAEALTNIGAVNKAGGTMTGALAATQISVRAIDGDIDKDSASFTFRNYDSNSDTATTYGNHYVRFKDSKHIFASYGVGTERYALPAPTAALEEDINYEILTSKSAVAIKQGGTGKTTAEEALAALGGVAKAGDTMTSHLHIQSSSDPTVYFEDADGNGCGSVFGSAKTGSTYLRSYASDTAYYENYKTPATNDGLTANKTYDILTTKTVTYGTKDPETAVGAAGIAGRIYFKKVT